MPVYTGPHERECYVIDTDVDLAGLECAVEDNEDVSAAPFGDPLTLDTTAYTLDTTAITLDRVTVPPVSP